MIRNGIKPNGASPARRASDRDSAGLIDVTKSRQREDHSTCSFGRSCRGSRNRTTFPTWRVWLTLEICFGRGLLFQLYPQFEFLFRPMYGRVVPVPMPQGGGPAQFARAEVPPRHRSRSYGDPGRARRSGSPSLKYGRHGRGQSRVRSRYGSHRCCGRAGLETCSNVCRQAPGPWPDRPDACDCKLVPVQKPLPYSP